MRGLAADSTHASRLAARLGRAKLALGDAVGQAELSDGLRARRCSWPPLRPTRVCREHESVPVVCPAASRSIEERRERAVHGPDVHRDFCEVAIAEGGAGRIETTSEALRLFAESLGSEDSVALEATTQAAQVARLGRVPGSGVGAQRTE